MATPARTMSRGEGTPEWTAPSLIKLLGVSESRTMFSTPPRTIFAGEVIVSLSGESEDQLRSRPGLRQYYEGKQQSDRMANDG